MTKLTFKVKLDGMTSSDVAALSAPFDVETTFGTKARVPVRGTINGFPFRSSLMPMGGCHRMVINKQMRDGAGVKAGDTVTVVMERDEAPRTVEIPDLLKKELAKKQACAIELGETVVYQPERDGSFNHRSETGRDTRKKAREGNGRSEERQEVDRLAPESAYKFADIALLEESNRCDAGSARVEAGGRILDRNASQGEHWNS